MEFESDFGEGSIEFRTRRVDVVARSSRRVTARHEETPFSCVCYRARAYRLPLVIARRATSDFISTRCGKVAAVSGRPHKRSIQRTLIQSSHYPESIVEAGARTQRTYSVGIREPGIAYPRMHVEETSPRSFLPRLRNARSSRRR